MDSDIQTSLMNVNCKSVSKVPYKDMIILAKIYKVYDGDTCTVVFMYGDKPFKISARISGIDTPEIRTSNPLEKEAGRKVRDHVRGLILDKVLPIKFEKWGKWGSRLITEIYLDNPPKRNLTLTSYLLKHKIAREYSGGEKKDWTDSELRYIIDNC